MKSITHDFSLYYYNLLFTGDIDNCRLILKNWKDDKVIIQKITDDRYFIMTGKQTNETLTPKIGNKDNFKINELKKIDLEEEDELFWYLFIVIDLSCKDILSNSWGIISAFKTTKWEPWIKEVSKFLKDLFDNSNCWITPIIYKKTTKYDYLNSESRLVSNISFKVAGVNPWRKLIGEDDKSLDELFKLKQILGGDEITYSIKSEKDAHLKKWSILSFLKKNEETIENVIVDIDEFWSKISQRLEKIRFKDSINLAITDRNLESIDKVKEEMNKSFDHTIILIKEEYNFID